MVIKVKACGFQLLVRDSRPGLLQQVCVLSFFCRHQGQKAREISIVTKNICDLSIKVRCRRLYIDQPRNDLFHGFAPFLERRSMKYYIIIKHLTD